MRRPFQKRTYFLPVALLVLILGISSLIFLGFHPVSVVAQSDDACQQLSDTPPASPTGGYYYTCTDADGNTSYSSGFSGPTNGSCDSALSDQSESNNDDSISYGGCDSQIPSTQTAQPLGGQTGSSNPVTGNTTPPVSPAGGSYYTYTSGGTTYYGAGFSDHASCEAALSNASESNNNSSVSYGDCSGVISASTSCGGLNQFIPTTPSGGYYYTCTNTSNGGVYDSAGFSGPTNASCEAALSNESESNNNSAVVYGGCNTAIPTYSSVSSSSSSNSLSSLFPNTTAAGSNICDFLSKILTLVSEIGAVIGVLFLLWCGFLFIVAQGNEEKIKTAKRVFWTTMLGVTLLLSASIIGQLLITTINSVVSSSNSGTSGSASSASSSNFCSTGS